MNVAKNKQSLVKKKKKKKQQDLAKEIKWMENDNEF